MPSISSNSAMPSGPAANEITPLLSVSRFSTANILPPIALSPTQKTTLLPHCNVSSTCGRRSRKARALSLSMPRV